MDEKLHQITYDLSRVMQSYRAWRTSADLRGIDHEETERRAITARSMLASVRADFDALESAICADLDGAA